VRLDGEKIRASRRVARDAPRGTRARDEIERARIGDGDVARRRCDARDAVMRDARRRARRRAMDLDVEIRRRRSRRASRTAAARGRVRRARAYI
jgi:hypothetical protein